VLGTATTYGYVGIDHEGVCAFADGISVNVVVVESKKNITIDIAAILFFCFCIFFLFSPILFEQKSFRRKHFRSKQLVCLI
jgi:hypothetical protein